MRAGHELGREECNGRRVARLESGAAAEAGHDILSGGGEGKRAVNVGEQRGTREKGIPVVGHSSVRENVLRREVREDGG